MFVSAFMLVFVIAAFWQFSFAFCRTLLTTYSQVELSGKVEKVMGLTVDSIQPREFNRLMVLVRVAPDPGDDGMEISAVGMYYRAVALASAFMSLISAPATKWCDRELARCSYFAAVTLDRRLVSAAD
jgi:hypothetical protein